MNLAPRWTDALADEGIEAAHWSSIGVPFAPDDDIVDHARRHGLVPLAHDLDFGTLLAVGGDASPSAIQLRVRDVSPEAAGPVVTRALRQLTDRLDAGAIVTIEDDRVRVRLLPIGT